jgi:hypothetical protein
MDLFGEIIQSVFLTEGIATVSGVNDAINNLTPVEIRYTPVDKNNQAVGRRIIYPVAYGLTKAGNPVIRAFEPYGDTHTKVPAWKFFLLSGIRQWRPLSKKSFKGETLTGFNPDGDESMSVVYNIANIAGKPKDFKPTDIKTGSVSKGDINLQAQEKEVEKETQPNKMFTSQEIINDLLGGIKSQVNNPNKKMVSPEVMAQIEKDNARKKLRQAKKQGKKLDNEQELLNIIKGTPANRMLAPKTQAVTKNDIISQNKGVEQQQLQNIPTKPIYKNDLDDEYEVKQGDIDKLKEKWGLK